jgi:Zn-dependent protease with chaperone function
LHATSDTGHSDRHRRLTLGLQFALSSLGLAASVAAIASAAGSVHRDSTARTASVLGAHFTYPAVNVAAAVLLLLAIFGVAVIATCAAEVVRLRRGYHDFVAHLPVLGTLPEHPDVALFAGDAPQAFCAGYLRPRIYVSTGAVALLAPDELEAVLQHEQKHLEARDPLRLVCARVFGRGLFFVPALRPLADRYVELAELRADAAAVAAAGGDRRALASALLAFESGSPPGSGGLAAERVDALLGERIRGRLPRLVLATSLVALSTLVVVLWRTSAVASAHASFNLPVLSAQPCMLVLALVPLVSVLVLAGTRRA